MKDRIQSAIFQAAVALVIIAGYAFNALVRREQNQ